MIALALRVLPLAFAVWIADYSLAPRIHQRYVSVYDRVSGECRSYRSQSGFEHSGLCADDRFSPRPTQMSREARALLKEAQDHLARSDAEAARGSIDRAIALAHAADQSGTLIGGLVGASIVRGVLDFAELHPDVVAPKSAAERCELFAFSHPLTGERLRSTLELVQDFDLDPIREAMRAEQAINADLRLHEMEAAILAGDKARCDRAADGIGGVYCANAPAIVREAKRVAKLRGWS